MLQACIRLYRVYKDIAKTMENQMEKLKQNGNWDSGY